ncbi:MAG: MurR/RpiR family transcriptional regulator [Thermodesulfobacteriota bacterium]|nr:MurR/RpiR family transcriptional regulator [Thermodesulfobacteriota bacterium]
MASHIPESLEELRHLYIKIRNGEHTTRLTDRTLAVLKRMLDEPNETAAKSISEIAFENDINISSITRLAQKLGFNGFPSLKDLFRSNLKQRKSFYSEQVKKILQEGYAGDDGETSLLERVIQDEWSNVMLMADAFDEQRFTNSIKLMVNAERILIVGLRGSYSLAHYLGFYLKMIRDRVSLIGQAGYTLADDLSVLKPGDLLIAISVNPYTKDTAEACRICKHQAVDIIAITDSLSSPLAIETDNFLITSIEGDYFFSSIAAAIICIETLLSELVKQLGDKAIQRLNHTEYILEKLETEI